MTRGGGDVSGAIVANIAGCLWKLAMFQEYIYWSSAINNPREIKVISHTELRELSYGASVHEEAIFPCSRIKISQFKYVIIK